MTTTQLIAAPLAALMLAIPGVGNAQAAPKAMPKIGVVSIPMLLQQSPQAAALNKTMEEQFGPRKRELLAKQNELKERQAKFDKDSQVMGAEERRNAESKLRDDERDLARQVSALREDADVRQNEEVGKMQREIVREVAAFAKQNGYDLILGDGVLYADPSLDVTAKILASMDANSKNKPAPSPARQ